jgi:hypothetical protein
MKILEQLRLKQLRPEAVVVYCHSDDSDVVLCHPEVLSLSEEFPDATSVQVRGGHPRNLVAFHVSVEKPPEQRAPDVRTFWRSLVSDGDQCGDVPHLSHDSPTNFPSDGEHRCILRRGHGHEGHGDDSDERPRHSNGHVCWYPPRTRSSPSSGEPAVTEGTRRGTTGASDSRSEQGGEGNSCDDLTTTDPR